LERKKKEIPEPVRQAVPWTKAPKEAGGVKKVAGKSCEKKRK